MVDFALDDRRQDSEIDKSNSTSIHQMRIVRGFLEENPYLSSLNMEELKNILVSEEKNINDIETSISKLAEEENEQLSNIENLNKKIYSLKKSLEEISNDYAKNKKDIFEVEKQYMIMNYTAIKLRDCISMVKNFNIYKSSVVFKITDTSVEINNCLLASSGKNLASVDQINCAFGNIVLIHNFLVQLINYTDENFQIIYNGTQSMIRVSGNSSKATLYPLYCMNTMRLLWKSKFDQGIAHFSNYFLNIFTHMKSRNIGSAKLLILPKAISNGYIYSESATYLFSESKKYSLAYNSNTNECWFLAMKYFIEDIQLLTMHILINYFE